MKDYPGNTKIFYGTIAIAQLVVVAPGLAFNINGKYNARLVLCVYSVTGWGVMNGDCSMTFWFARTV